MPAGAKVLPYRSNIPKMSQFCFVVCDEAFPQRAQALGRSCVVGGANYGQGSSREHAALVPLYLGVRCVIAKSFARIHAANLINAGILPLTFDDPGDYDRLKEGDTLAIRDIHARIASVHLTAETESGGKIALAYPLTQRQIAILRAGGLLTYTKEASK
jgi:aconitate hydratase